MYIDHVMADKKISEFDSFPGKQDSKTHYIISSGDAGGEHTDNYKVAFPDLASGISGEVLSPLSTESGEFSHSLTISGVTVSTGSSAGGAGGIQDPNDGSFNFGPTDSSNNTDTVNFNQGENVRMYIDENGGVNVSEKLIVSDGKETVLGGNTTIKETLTVADGKETVLGGNTTIKETLTVADGKETVLGGNTTIKETLTVADGKETTLGGPVTIKGDSTFEQSAIFTDLTTDPDPSTGKLYRKGDDIYFGGQKLLTDGSSGAGKWSDGTIAGQIHYSGGNVGIGIDAPTAKLHVSRLDQNEIDSALTVFRGDTNPGNRPTTPIFNVFNGTSGGTEIFRIQGNGNVGIGETSPSEQLVVRNQSTTSNKVTIGLSSKDGTQNGAFSHIHEAGEERITLSAGGFNVDQFTMKNNGNVGIGVDSPDAKLEVKGGESFRVIGTDNTTKLRVYSDNHGAVLGLGDPAGDDDLIRLDARSQTPNTSWFNSGDLGIGIKVPDSLLHVNKSDNEVVPLLTLSNYDDTNYSANQGAALDFGLARDTGTHFSNSGRIYVGKEEAWADSNDGLINSFMSFSVLSGMVPTERMRLDSNGRLCIGTDQPAARLHLSHSGNNTNPEAHSAGSDIIIQNNSTVNGSFTALNFYGPDRLSASIRSQVLDHNTNEGNLIFYTVNGAGGSIQGQHRERMRIDQNGKIGINLPAPTHYIDAKPSNQSDQFTARFTTEHNNSMMHSALIFAKTEQGGTATADGSIMGSVGWEGKDTNNTVRHCGMIKIVQRGAANANGRITDMYLHTADGNLYDNASISNHQNHEKLRLKGGGGVILARLDSAPSNPDAGEMYFDTTNNTFYGYNGSTWKPLHG